MSEKKRVAIYIRVSTQEQKMDGYGLEAQKRRLVEYVFLRSVEFVTKPEWVFCDTHTGSDLNRKELNELRQKVKDREFDAVLVWKIDRLSRSLKHLLTIFEELEKNDVSFISVQENIDFRGPIGKMIFQIFGAIAQFERELIKGRTHMGRIASAEMGNYTGTMIPYAYKAVPNPNGKGKRLEIVPKEKKWVQEIFRWYIYEDLGLGQIADRLNELKVPKASFSNSTWRFTKWTPDILIKLITNTIYRGEYVANRKDDQGRTLPEKDWTIVQIPACISEFTFQQAQNIRENKVAGRRNKAYLLSGKLIDVTLAEPRKFVGCKRSKGGYSYRRKQFVKDDVRIPVFEVPAKPIEDFVWNKVLEALKDPEQFIEKFLNKEFSDPDLIQKINDSLGNLREQKLNEELSMARIEDAYERGHYDQDKMNRKLAEKNQSVAKIETKIFDLEDHIRLLHARESEIENLREASEQVSYILNDLKPEHRRILSELFVDRIEMTRQAIPGKKRWDIDAIVYFRFNPERLFQDISPDRTHSSLNKDENGAKEQKKTQAGRSGGT